MKTQNVNMIVAKVDADVLAEGQKIPMKKEGNYYTENYILKTQEIMFIV